MKTIIVEFEKVTKYPLLNFLVDYRDFILNSYPFVFDYFSGKTETIDNRHLIALRNLTDECKNVNSQFKNFANKFSNCGYWELMDMVEDLNTVIEKINKFPKFLRTAKTQRGYMPYIQVSGVIGGMKTVEDIANTVKQTNQDNSNWIDIMLSNDMDEQDWEIDKISAMKVFINNKTDIVVTTILEQPIGRNIYGRDVASKITFADNDVLVVSYEDNIEQKCDILLNLNRGDVPENMLFGKNIDLITGVAIKQFAYPILVRDIQNNFLQNNLFQYVNVTNFQNTEGRMKITCEIKTKYDYKTAKTIAI